MKQFIKVALVSVFSLGMMVVPMAQQASAATTYSVDPVFEDCMENLYKQRWPYTKNRCVGRIQRFLNEYRYLLIAKGERPANWPALKIDNKYGPETKKAVKAYQQHKNTDGDPSANSGPIDGKVGPLTWASIERDCVDAWGAKNFHSRVCYKASRNN